MFKIFLAMKKLNYFPMFILLIASIFVISCSKESSPLYSGSTQNNDNQLPGSTEIGSVVDLGLINPDTRVMLTTLTVQSFTINNNEVPSNSAQIALVYYVNQDSRIPDGEYSFSNSDAKSPFTFDSAMFVGGVDSNGYPIPSEKIVDGSVLVSQDGGNYVFQIQGHLESGTVFTGSSKGSVTYTDNNMY
jgi:hypothetical protein